jgi:hypothetical protein
VSCFPSNAFQASLLPSESDTIYFPDELEDRFSGVFGAEGGGGGAMNTAVKVSVCVLLSLIT